MVINRISLGGYPHIMDNHKLDEVCKCLGFKYWPFEL